MRQQLKVNLYVRINHELDSEYLTDLFRSPLLDESTSILIQTRMKNRKWAIISVNLEVAECLKKNEPLYNDKIAQAMLFWIISQE